MLRTGSLTVPLSSEDGLSSAGAAAAFGEDDEELLVALASQVAVMLRRFGSSFQQASVV